VLLKKVNAMLLALSMVLTLGACSSNSGTSEIADVAPSASSESQAQETTTPAPSDSEPERSDETETAEPTEPTDSTNILVAYFSATNTTEMLAEYLADGLGADLYEIVPETPYTDADLNWNDSSSRSTIEMNDASARPTISGSVDHMEQYDIVLLGYPIWWGEAPRIISTFLESYDFSGKTIVPFCTSSSSGIGSSAKNLHSLCADSVTWLDGKRFPGGTSSDEVMEWANGLGLDLTAE
jgi:flavodoxin